MGSTWTAPGDGDSYESICKAIDASADTTVGFEYSAHACALMSMRALQTVTGWPHFRTNLVVGGDLDGKDLERIASLWSFAPLVLVPGRPGRFPLPAEPVADSAAARARAAGGPSSF